MAQRQYFEHKPKQQQLVYGTHPVVEALRNGVEIDKILVKKNMKLGIFSEIRTLAAQLDIPVQEVPQEKLQKLTTGNHQGVIAIRAVIRYQKITDIIPFLFEQGKNPFVLVLDRVTDVRNFGAICRTAECAGVDAVVIPSRGAAQINEDAIKTSAGALTTLPVCRSYNLKETLEFLRESGVLLIAISEKGRTEYSVPSYEGPVALMLGSEEDGISPEYLKLSDEKVQIPMYGSIGSLNVSVAAGIMMFEVRRQRNLAE